MCKKAEAQKRCAGRAAPSAGNGQILVFPNTANTPHITATILGSQQSHAESDPCSRHACTPLIVDLIANTEDHCSTANNGMAHRTP